MTQEHSIASPHEVNSANGQIFKSNVYFSSTEKELHTASVSDIPLEFSFTEQCRASQPAEGTCLEKAIATSSLETVAVEEISAIPLTRSYPPMLSVTDPALIALCFLGMVSISSVSLVSVVALVFGRDISLAAVLDPMGSMRLKTKKKAKDTGDK